MDEIKPFSEDISVGTFFDPGDIQDDPAAKIAVPIPARPAFEYTGPIKKSNEIIINDLKRGKVPIEKIDIYFQMVGIKPKSQRGRWIQKQIKRYWDDAKLLQLNGYRTDVYNTRLLNFLKKQDKEWLYFTKTRDAGITWNSVTQGLMKDLGITKDKAEMKIISLLDPKEAKRLSSKDKIALKKYNAGDLMRSSGKKPMVGFGEFYHRDVGWY